MSDLFLGVDTSCYTTSLAVVNERADLVCDVRRLLDVHKGERGLQQSAALFQHIRNLPGLLREIANRVELSEIKGVAVSSSPRPAEGSYMPVFNAGIAQAETIGLTLKVPVVYTSHQEGHLMAGIWSASGPTNEDFLAVHMSGGTTELLKVVNLTQYESASGRLFEVALLGGTTDLHAGQFVDRVGVRMGLPFPAGPGLESMAREGPEGRGLIPSAVRGYDLSFSGPESHAQRLLDHGVSSHEVARAVESCIVKSIFKLVLRGVEDFELSRVLIVGGVAANLYIREELRSRLGKTGIETFFAEPRFSSDNAVGTALIAHRQLKK